MKFGCLFKNPKTSKKVGASPVQGYLLEVLAETSKRDWNARLLVIGKIRHRNRDRKFFVWGSHDTKLLPERLDWKTMVGIEGFHKGLALGKCLCMDG